MKLTLRTADGRYEVLAVALDWVSCGAVDGYMARHRFDANVDELRQTFQSVIDWADGGIMAVEMGLP